MNIELCQNAELEVPGFNPDPGKIFFFQIKIMILKLFLRKTVWLTRERKVPIKECYSFRKLTGNPELPRYLFIQEKEWVWECHHSDMYEGGLKSFQPSLRETWDKWPLDRELNRSWCHRHTTSMIKLFWSQPIAPWASGVAYGQGEKFSVWPTTDVKLGTSSHWVRTWTGAGVTPTLLWSFLDRSPCIHGLSGSTLVCCGRCPWSHRLQPKKL